MGLALAHADLDLYAAVLPIHPQQRQRAAADSGGVGQLEDFPLVQKQPAGAFLGVVIPLAGGLPGLDVATVEECLVVLDARESVGDIHLPGADRFDLGAFQLDASLDFRGDVEIAPGFAVGGDFRAHGLPLKELPCEPA